jgi:1-acyl-sn-glycerol-3-phosphate acyltransferase
MATDAPPTPGEHDFVPRLMHALNTVFSRIYHQVEVLSPCRLPRYGAAILVCNHIGGIDPLFLQAVCPRVIRWMMAREYYKQPGLKWLLDQIGTIPVDRSGRDLAATRAALATLEAGGVVGIFPEGKISTTNELLPFQSGIVLLAAKSGAPVYPACLEGTQRGKEMVAAYFSRNRAKLAFGPPLVLDRDAASRPNLQAATEKVRNAVEILRETYIFNRK